MSFKSHMSLKTAYVSLLDASMSFCACTWHTFGRSWAIWGLFWDTFWPVWATLGRSGTLLSWSWVTPESENHALEEHPNNEASNGRENHSIFKLKSFKNQVKKTRTRGTVTRKHLVLLELWLLSKHHYHHYHHDHHHHNYHHHYHHYHHYCNVIPALQ